MLVHGAIIPPRTVLDAVVEVVRSVGAPAEDGPAPSPRGFLGRMGRKPDAPAPTVTAASMLDFVPLGKLHFPVTGFGNLTVNDAHRLADAISDAAADWTAPTVYFAGGAALDFPGDPCVWAKLGGEVDALGAIARGVTQSVERLGFFVDRRVFRPMLSLATVNQTTTGPYLQMVVDALDSFRGEEWSADHIVLTRDVFETGRTETAEFQRIALRRTGD